MEHHDEAGPAEHSETLWMIPAAPAVWALHFLACYVTVAVWCAKVAGVDGPLGPARWMVGGYTIAALLGIAAIGWWGWRHHSFGDATVPHDFDTAADRHRFLGFATVLLAGLSFVSTLFVGLAAIFIGSCQ